MRENKTIMLVGLPGVGKTTVGTRLAARLSLSFADIDAEIEAKAGADVGDIFRAEGESGFRQRERAAIVAALEGDAGVVALGGGGFADADIRALLLARATIVWLDAPDAVIVERIGDSGHRPLFGGQDVGDVLRRLRTERTAAYQQAHLHVCAATSAECVDAILGALKA